MMHRYFMTGTDTEVGKTTISLGFLRQLRASGYRTVALKPIASGCQMRAGKYYNDDALQLSRAATVKLPYEQVNPFAFLPPVAPHIAAQQAGCSLCVEEVVNRLSAGLAHPADYYIIEGVGGWHVPLNEHETMAEVAISLSLPVILVIAIKLGCLNHALLTVEAIKQSGLPLSGWVANCLCEKTAVKDENIATLKQWIAAPCLGIVPFGGDAVQYLKLPPIKFKTDV